MGEIDQLEVIDALGQVRFFPLSPDKGFTNIGSHPGNDLVIDSTDVAPFHAVLDHRQKPYQLTLLSGQGHTHIGGHPVSPNTPISLTHWDTIELDGHVLILVEGGPPGAHAAPDAGPIGLAAPPIPVALPAVANGDTALITLTPQAGAPADDLDAVLASLDKLADLPADRADDLVVASFSALLGKLDTAEPSALDFRVAVEQTATAQAVITNGGDLVATFNVSVAGIDPAWVTITPPQINLNEGERAAVKIEINAPRLSTSRAGPHFFAVVVTSPNYPGRYSAMGGLLVLEPYFDFSVGEVTPKSLRLPWSQRFGDIALPLTNRGNGDARVQLLGEDDEHGCDFEFRVPGEAMLHARQTEVRLPANETQTIPLRITPHRRQLLALAPRTYSYTVTTTLLENGLQTPRSVLGQVRTLPLLGLIHLILLALIVAGLIILIFSPHVRYFGPNPETGDIGPVFIQSDQTIELFWRASTFARLRLEPDIGFVDGPSGSLQLSPPDTTIYKLTAENWLSLINRGWFSEAREVQVVVGKVLPSVALTATTPTGTNNIILGQTVQLEWEVKYAEEVVLLVNGAPETLPRGQFSGSRSFVPDQLTTYIIQVRNRYTGPDGVLAQVTINVTPPTPTPPPLPVVERFDILPSEISQGESVTIEWSVSGAKSVSIDPVGSDLPPSGRLVQSPVGSTVYKLTATNGQTPVTLLREVTVNPPPGAPTIEFFTVTPNEVAIGSPEARNLRLAWSVSGDVTNIEISGPDFGKVANLDKQGTLTTSTDVQTLYILTAYNGDLRSSLTAQVKVIIPIPVITSLSPLTTTIGQSSLNLLVNGTGFVNGSLVQWAGANRPTTFVSNARLQAVLQSTDLAAAGTYTVTVANPAPGGTVSVPASFIIFNPLSPTILSLSPSQAPISSTDVSVLVSGFDFSPQSVIRWKNVDRPTTYNSSTQLGATIPASDLTTQGTLQLQVINRQPDGSLSSSNFATFTINPSNPVPTVTSLNPASINAGVNTSTQVDVIGTNFNQLSLALWQANGQYLNSTYIDATTLRLDVPPELISASGAYPIVVSNPAPGGGTAAPITLTASAQVPVITSFAGTVTPVVGQSGVTVVITGSNFLSNATVQWNGQTRPSLFVGGNRLDITLTPGDLASAGTANQTVTVINPAPGGGSASRTLPFAINPAATVTSLSIPDANPTVYGQGIKLNATVNIVAPGSGALTGNVQFWDGAVSLGTAPVSGGLATLTIGNLSVGTHAITAQYVGTANFNTSTSAPVSRTVNKGSTRIYFYDGYFSPYYSAQYGQSISTLAFLEVIWPAGGTPSGTLDLYDNGILIASAPMTPYYGPYYQANFNLAPYALAAGNHSFYVLYNGDASYGASDSRSYYPAVNYTIVPGPLPAPTCSVSGNSLVVTVNTPGGALPPSGGTVQIDGTAILGGFPTFVSFPGIPLSGNVGTVTPGWLTGSIFTGWICTYSGDANYQPSPAGIGVPDPWIVP